jgi:hypothetical protein
MSQHLKPTVANYPEFKGYPIIEEAYSTHLVVVGKRNPFATEETDPTLPDPHGPKNS